MRKLILAFCFCLIASTVSADEYWIKVRLEDRSGLTSEDDPGRSKRGDIVNITPVIEGQVPTQKAQEEWMIIKADLTKAQRMEMLKSLEEEKIRRHDLMISKEAWDDPWMRQHIIDTESLTVINTVPNGENGYIVTVDDMYYSPVAYRKNKLNLTTLGKSTKGLHREKVSPNKIRIDAKTQQDLDRYAWKQKWFAFIHPIRVAWNVYTRGLAYAAATNNKICAVGNNCTDEDYNNLTDWEDAVDGVLDGIQTATCYNDDGTFTASVAITINGSTTDSTNYMKVTVPAGERHDGYTGGTVFTMDTSGNRVFSVQDNYTLIEWVTIANWKSNDWSGGNEANDGLYLSGDGITARYNLVYGGDQMGTNTNMSYITGQVHVNYIYRNIVRDIIGQNANTTFGIDSVWHDTGKRDYVANNTVYDSEGGGIRGFNVAYIEVYNNISLGGTGFINCDTGDYNLDDDDTAPGANSIADGVAADEFVDTASDLHLKTGTAQSIDGGTDLGSPYDVDWEEDAVTGTWDIGADEYVSAVTAAPMHPIINIF